MSLITLRLFFALFVATFVVAPCFARASRFTPFLDKKQHEEFGGRTLSFMDFKPTFTRAYHTFQAWYSLYSAKRYEKKSDKYGMRAAWIGIGLGNESELKQISNRTTDESIDKPFFFTLPFRKTREAKNFIFNRIAQQYRMWATLNYENSKEALKTAQYHKAQLALLDKKP